MFPTRYRHVEVARRMLGSAVDRFGEALLQGDPLADAAMSDLVTLGASGHALVAQASREGIRCVSQAPPSLRAFFGHAEEVPRWVDERQLHVGGQLLMRSGLFGGFVLAFRSILLGYFSPGGNKPLVFTGRLEEQTAKRLFETAKFVQETCRPGSLSRFGEAYAITLHVRLMHAKVRAMLLAHPEWKADAWGIPINQHDMAATSLLFSLEVVEGLRALGFSLDADEVEAYMHVWKYSSFLMGVDPEWSTGTESEAWRLRRLTEATEGDETDDDGRRLVHALFESGVTVARTPVERRRAEWMKPFYFAVSRHLIGNRLADMIPIERTRAAWLMPSIMASVRAYDAAQRASRSFRALAIREGARYWNEVVGLDIFGGPAKFALPERLRRAA